MDLSEVSSTPHRRHPWEVARAQFFERVLSDAGALSTPRAILDVGAGDGFVGRRLLAAMPAGGRVVCLDAKYGDAELSALTAAAEPGLVYVREPPLDRFDVLLLLDVIEHVEDDRGFVGELIARSLAPGGLVLVSVPAWQMLFSAHDRALGHRRRYSAGACHDLLEGEGLRIVSSGGLFHTLFLARALTVAHEGLLRRLGREPAPPPNLGAWRRGALASRLAERGLALDTAFTRALTRGGHQLPGLSVWALCQVGERADAR